MTDKFQIFIKPEDLVLEKSKDKDGNEMLYVTGCASTDDVDADGDILEPSGFNYKPFLESGYVNWHHRAKDNPKAVIGQPIAAWVENNKFYVKAGLYGWNDLARTTYELMDGLDKVGSDRKLGWSIEGEATLRDPNNKARVKTANIYHVAITPMPKNKQTWAKTLKKGFDSLDCEDECIIDFKHPNGKINVKIFESGAIKIIPTKFLDLSEESILFSPVEEKAMSTANAGMIVREDVEDELKNLQFNGKQTQALIDITDSFDKGELGIYELDRFRKLIKGGYPVGYFTTDKSGITWVKVADTGGKGDWKVKNTLSSEELSKFFNFVGKPLHERIDFTRGYTTIGDKQYRKEIVVPSVVGSPKLVEVEIKRGGDNKWHVYKGGFPISTSGYNTFTEATNQLNSGEFNHHLDSGIGGVYHSLASVKDSGGSPHSTPSYKGSIGNTAIGIEPDETRNDKYWLTINGAKFTSYKNKDEALKGLGENRDYLDAKIKFSDGEELKIEGKYDENDEYFVGNFEGGKCIGKVFQDEDLFKANKAFFEINRILSFQKGSNIQFKKSGKNYFIIMPILKNVTENVSLKGVNSLNPNNKFSSNFLANLLVGNKYPLGRRALSVFSTGNSLKQLPTSDDILGMNSLSTFKGEMEDIKFDNLILGSGNRGIFGFHGEKVSPELLKEQVKLLKENKSTFINIIKSNLKGVKNEEKIVNAFEKRLDNIETFFKNNKMLN